MKAPLEHFDGDAFFVEPFWGSTITNSFNLGSSLLVCMLHQPDVSGPDDCENIAIGYEGSPSLIKLEEYLKMKSKRLIREPVLIKEDAGEFSSDERAKIRERFRRRGIRLRCVFIQRRDFVGIETNGWRANLMRVILSSRFSG